MRSTIITEATIALRSLRNTPAVAISAVLCIALALGATTAIWSAIDTALLRPLPFPDPGRLVSVYRTTPHFDTGPFSAPNYMDLARESSRISELGAAAPESKLLSLPAGTRRVSAHRVSGNFFSMLGVNASRGRMIAQADDAADANPVVVLSHEAWQEMLGGEEGVIGRLVLLDGRQHEVVGIAPRGFSVPHGAVLTLKSDLWLPMRFSEFEQANRRSNFLFVMGRLSPGAAAQEAHAELRQLFDGIAEANPELRGEQIRVLPLESERTRPVRRSLYLMMSAVVIVLLIAVTNVAALLLARGVQRQREIAIRAAVGGSRWRIMRPMLSETAIIVAAGLSLGLLLAWMGVRWIGALAVQRLPQLDGLGMDERVISFAIVLSVVVGALCGVAPAWRSSRVDPQDALRGGRSAAAGRAQHRALNGLVVVEVALSLMLLLAAGLVLRGFASLLERDPGFDPSRILTMEVTVSADQYPDGSSVRRFLDPALDAIRQVPGVEEAGAIAMIPYADWGRNFNIRYEGQPGDDPTTLPLTEWRTATPGLFAVTQQRLVGGRLLAETDRVENAPVAVVVNEALARRDFPDGDAVGRRFHIGDTTFATIVGIVSNVRNAGPVSGPVPEVYGVYRDGGTTFALMVRVRGENPMSVASAVQAAIRHTDGDAAVAHVRPMREVIAASLGRPRFFLSLLGVFAVVAVFLALAGLYGVMSYSVAQRTHEFGIRTALGSSARRAMALVTGHGMKLILLGLGVGMFGGYMATRLLVSLLYGVSPMDARAWVLATTLLATMGMLAALLPAWRASRVDPAVAMRRDG